MRSLLAMWVCMMMIGPLAVCHAEQPAIKLGALYNVTGNMSSIDAPASRGSLLAAKRINEKGAAC